MSEDNCKCKIIAEMPRYKCHKEVNAFKICSVFPYDEDGLTELVFEEIDIDGSPFNIFMNKEWIKKHSPEVGGYYVVYKGNYKSYSPAKAFEEGYTKL